MIESLTPGLSERVSDFLRIPHSAGFVLWPVVVIAASYLLGHGIEWVLLHLVPRFTGRTLTRVDDLVTDAVKGPVKILATLSGAAIAILLTPAPEALHGWTARFLVILLAIAGVVAAARFVGGLVLTYGDRARIVGPTRGLTKRVAVLAIYLVGALFVLDNQGVSITPLLTTLGLAGLAVALAFQDTLSNFFAGLYVQADRPLDIGHYVRIEDVNVEGYVVEVGWRTTKIRTLPNNIVVIPNARVASSVVTDYDLPEPGMSLLVGVPVPHGVDPRRVESILVEEAAKAAGEVEGLLPEPTPFVRFIPGFTDKGMEFTLICRVSKFVDQYLAQHELRHRITERFRKEGIQISVPIRTIKVESTGPVALQPGTAATAR